MPVLHVRTNGGAREIPFLAGACVRAILIANGLGVRSDCGGVGSCGHCRVQILSGEMPPPNSVEIRRLRPEQLNHGLRLACELFPTSDLTLWVPALAESVRWQLLAEDDLVAIEIPSDNEAGDGLGAAVDLGTTHIRVSVWDLGTQVRLGARMCLNPQLAFGSDVMTRLVAARGSSDAAAQISRLASQAIGGAIEQIVESAGRGSARLCQATIVGNTAMLALLSKQGCELLLKPEYWTREVDFQPATVADLKEDLRVGSSGAVSLIPSVAGFVGSDLLAGLLATELTKQAKPAMLIDFGTNSEMALWDGGTLWTTSAAGGPAFEGTGITCGMSAEEGAIFRVEDVGGYLQCDVIGYGAAKGVCGSGLVDVIACLLRRGALSRGGRFSHEISLAGFSICDNDGGVLLSPRDVDAFQRAKGAVGAGTADLLEKAGLEVRDIRRLCVCGAFGQHLNVPNAQAVGLVPQVPVEAVELWANSAIAGCELMLLSGARRSECGKLRAMAKNINLACEASFEKRFIDNLSLQPFEARRLEDKQCLMRS